jgi:Double zinc ribbon
VSVASRSLDDLDRLAFRLSRTIRTQYPHLLTQGFTLTDLEERLLPFRDARREMADGGVAAFEHAILRLLAGERGYVQVDAALRAAAAQALGAPSPSLSLVRMWATATLTLTPPATGIGLERMAAPPATDIGERMAETKAETKPCGCRYCGSVLPDNRRMTFCPYCGTDLTKRHCPACSTELDVHWRFCVTCGRSADLPDGPTPMRRAG